MHFEASIEAFEMNMDGKTAAALVRCYYKCNDSAAEAIRQYSYRENNLKHPICSEKVLRGIVKRFEETGNANPVKAGGRTSSIRDRMICHYRFCLCMKLRH